MLPQHRGHLSEEDGVVDDRDKIRSILLDWNDITIGASRDRLRGLVEVARLPDPCRAVTRKLHYPFHPHFYPVEIWRHLPLLFDSRDTGYRSLLLSLRFEFLVQ